MSVARIVVALLAGLVATLASAATITERSPFAQGQWWDPSRSGHGFEILSVRDQVAIVWFTYDDRGRPVWYTANGRLDALGTEALPLMRHRWENGAKGGADVVGSLRLTLRSFEAADVAFEVDGRRGTWQIQPLVVSGVIPEIDHSGLWFDAGNSGWGVSLTQQGDVLGGLLYTYDAAGAPTWVAGWTRDSPDVAFRAYSGTCPTCAWREATSTGVGQLSFDLRSEAEMTMRSGLALGMASGIRLDGARISQLGRPASWRSADRQLARFDTAASLTTYLHAGMVNIRPYSGGSFSAAPPPVAFSPTNLQEAGVDEAGLVKSDGSHVYTFAHDANGLRQPMLRIARVLDDGAGLEVRASVPLSGSRDALATAGLFVHGDALVAVTSTQASTPGGQPWLLPAAWLNGTTSIEVFSIASPGTPVTRWRAQLDGHLLASRRIGDMVYVVMRFAPYVPGFYYGAIDPTAVAANRALLARTPVADLLPKVMIDGGAAIAAVEPTAVYAPPGGARSQIADMVVVVAIDLASPRIAQSLAIVGWAETVYVSATSIVVAGTRVETRDPVYGLLLPEPIVTLTDLHQIALGPQGLAITGSASIEGSLGSDVNKAAFRLSDHEGRLRAVSSSTTMWGETRNRLTVLEPSTIASGLLKTVAVLPNARRPETLGKPQEVLYGVRFLGSRLYAVTFRQVDPLYVVDLSDSTDPRIAGALEIPGFSDYLHPLPNGLLLGFGRDALPASEPGDGQFAWMQGLQLSLFDVSDANRPRELQRMKFGKRGSTSALFQHHHAFSALMRADGTGQFAFPARLHDGEPYGSGPSAWYPWQSSGLVRVEMRGTGPADARLVELPKLVTHTAQTSPPWSPDDASASDARSVLFRNGTIYVGNGRFWRQDAAGVTFGPL